MGSNHKVEKAKEPVVDIGEYSAERRREPDWNKLMPLARPEPSPETVGLVQEEADFVDHYLSLADSLLNAPDADGRKAS